MIIVIIWFWFYFFQMHFLWNSLSFTHWFEVLPLLYDTFPDLGSISWLSVPLVNLKSHGTYSSIVLSHSGLHMFSYLFWLIFLPSMSFKVFLTVTVYFFTSALEPTVAREACRTPSSLFKDRVKRWMKHLGINLRNVQNHYEENFRILLQDTNEDLRTWIRTALG